MYKNASDEDRAGLRDAMCQTWLTCSRLRVQRGSAGGLRVYKTSGVAFAGEMLELFDRCFAMLSPINDEACQPREAGRRCAKGAEGWATGFS